MYKSEFIHGNDATIVLVDMTRVLANIKNGEHLFQSVKIIKSKERLRYCHRSEETKETL